MITLYLFYVKTAALSSAYKSRDVARACDTILDMGFDCVEVMAYLPHVNLQHISATADALSPYEGRISGFGIYENLADLREQQRLEAVQKTIACIELCSKTGGAFVVLQTGLAPSFLRHEAETTFEQSLSHIVPAARQYNVKLAFENATNTLLSTTEEVFSFVKAHPDDHICLTVDPVNFYESKSPCHIEKLQSKTVNLHVKNVSGGKEAPLETGDVDFQDILSRGWDCIYTAEYEESPQTHQFLSNALQVVRWYSDSDNENEKGT